VAGIMQMTAQELTQILGAKRAVVELGYSPVEADAEQAGTATDQDDRANLA